MEQTVDLSPYIEDGVRNYPLSLETRVPIVNRHRTRWYYVTAIVVGGWPYRDGAEPTDDEIRMVGSFHEEYCSYWYGPPHTGYRGRVLDTRPFDIDGGAVGRLLTKYEHGGWGYRLHTWEYGPVFAPNWDAAPMALEQVLDRVHSIGDEVSKRWLKWKADHADVFGGT